MTPATILEHDGIKQPITEWALDYGVTPAIIIGRLERGMTIADAITTPMKTGHNGQRLPVFSKKQINTKRRTNGKRAKTYTYNGRTLSVPEWSRVIGLKEGTIGARLRAGQAIEEVFGTPLNYRKSLPRRAGVSSDFAPSEGTGAGSTAQEIPNITFSGNDA